jgi:glutaredoxin
MIKIYGMNNCPYCEELKDLLDGENIEYVSVDINEKENKEEVDTVFNITKVDSVPIIRVGKQLLAPDVSFSSIKEAFELTKQFMA